MPEITECEGCGESTVAKCERKDQEAFARREEHGRRVRIARVAKERMCGESKSEQKSSNLSTAASVWNEEQF